MTKFFYITYHPDLTSEMFEMASVVLRKFKKWLGMEQCHSGVLCFYLKSEMRAAVELAKAGLILHEKLKMRAIHGSNYLSKKKFHNFTAGDFVWHSIFTVIHK